MQRDPDHTLWLQAVTVGAYRPCLTKGGLHLDAIALPTCLRFFLTHLR